MKQKPDYDQIARYLAGECTGREKEKIESALANDPELKGFIKEIGKNWGANKDRPNHWDTENTWKRLSARMDQEDIFSSRSRQLHQKRYQFGSIARWSVRIAAVLMIAGLTTLFTLYYSVDDPTETEPVWSEVTTERSQRAEVQLEDGTRIRMNSDTKITYPGEFNSEVRNVYLSGEAYFEVAHDERPFFVHAEEAVIRILGTEFNVEAYSDEEHLQVVVAGGEVEVRLSGDHDEIKIGAVNLQKGDKADLQRHSGQFSVSRNVHLPDHLGWLENRLQFENEALDGVAKKLERWYGVEIDFAHPAISELSLSATFEDHSIQEVLRIMQLSLDLEYELQGRGVTFYKKD